MKDNNKSVSTTQKSDAEIFLDLLNKSAEGLVEAGKFAAEAYERDPGFIENVRDTNEYISEEVVRRFIALGQRKLHVSLIWTDTPGVRRLRRMPYEIQEKYSANPLPVLIKTEDGCETLNVDIRNMTREQVDQVFGADYIRSEAEQRAWIESVPLKTAKSLPPAEKYRVRNGELEVFEYCKFNAKELNRIMSEIIR